MRPAIAVVGQLIEEPRAEVLRLPLHYTTAIERAGGWPFVVAYPLADGTQAAVEGLLARADGLLFSGGADFDMARLGRGPTHPAARPVPPRKQDFDFALARAALKAGLPTLGICYGMQLLGLASGGSLLQHLPDDRPGSQPHTDKACHGVTLEPGSALFALAGTSRLEGISHHHQALGSVGPGWRATAHDDEGLIEGIEHAHGFAIGVQWHPEVSAGPGHERLFAGLVAAARAHAARRTTAPAQDTATSIE
jgi:putative glutamine amidotransferase